MSTQMTVMALGNPTMGDDGVGQAMLRQLLPSLLESRGSVDFVDAGTASFEMLPWVCDAENLLVLDACSGVGNPGAVLCIQGEAAMRALQQPSRSGCCSGMSQLMAVASMVGAAPRRIAIVGVAVERITVGCGLSPVVAQAIPRAASTAHQLIEKWVV